jgi:hypothetical protein
MILGVLIPFLRAQLEERSRDIGVKAVVDEELVGSFLESIS